MTQDLEYDVPVVDENNQEWVFTLYDFDNSGKVTKEVMAVLLTFCITLKKHSGVQFVSVLFYAVGYVQPDAYNL